MAEPTEADRERAFELVREAESDAKWLPQQPYPLVVHRVAAALAAERERAYWTVVEAGDVWVSRDRRARPSVVVDFLTDLAGDVRHGRQFRHPAFTIAAEETGQ